MPIKRDLRSPNTCMHCGSRLSHSAVFVKGFIGRTKVPESCLDASDLVRGISAVGGEAFSRANCARRTPTPTRVPARNLGLHLADASGRGARTRAHVRVRHVTHTGAPPPGP